MASNESPSYKRYVELFNENWVGREWTTLLKKHDIAVRLDGIEKLFRSKAKDVPLVDKPPALLKRKSTIPWGAGTYWFTAI